MAKLERLHDIFSSVAEKYPENAAVVTTYSYITYCQLDRISNQISSRIAPAICPGGPVVIYLSPGIPFVCAVLAVLKACSAYVPVDINDPPVRTGNIIKTSSGSAQGRIITTQALAKRIERIDDCAVIIMDEETLAISGHLPLQAAKPEPGIPEPGIYDQEDAYIIFTSGSTGNPKGIAISHPAIINLVNAFNRIASIGSEDRCSLWSSLNFDVSVYEIWSALLTGACLYIPDDSIRFSPEKFIDWLRHNGITSAYIPPFMLTGMAETGNPPLSLRRMLTGVDPIPEPLLCRIKGHIPGLCLINGYGPAEAAVCASLYTVPSVPSRPGNAPVGKPVENLEIHILDESGRPAGKGEKGEICIKGIQVARGYLGDPELSAQRFVPDPFSKDPALMYKTGDLGYLLDDGNLMFAGRIDFQIKHRGVRIEPGEIESRIMAFPGVSQAAVVLKTGRSGNKILIAYMDGRPDEKLLFEALRSRIPRSMLPSALIRLDFLPQTVQGKIDRKALEKRDDQELETDSPEQALSDPHPWLEEEKQIGAIWKQVLGLTRLARDDNFFLVGGDSIAGVRIISRVNHLFNKALDLNELLNYPQFKDFSARVILAGPREKGTGNHGYFSGKGHQPGEFIPLLCDQELIWLFENLNPGTSVYHIPLAYQVLGQLDPDLLKTAVSIIRKRHSALNLVFSLKDGRAFQTLKMNPLSFVFTQAANSGLLPQPSQEQCDAFRRQWLFSQTETCFDLEEGPLFRTGVLKMNEYEYYLCFTFHHLVFDGWSASLFISELNKVYAGLARKENICLPDPGITYQDYVLNTVNSIPARLHRADGFFKDYLQDLPRETMTGNEGLEADFCLFSIDENKYNRIKKIAGDNNTSAFAVLLSFFQVLMFAATHENDQITGIAYAGRNGIETESLIGFLMNTLAARNQIRAESGFTEFLARVKKNLEVIFKYADIPFYEVSRFCRDQGRTEPVFNCLFLMQTMDFPFLDLPETRSDYLYAKTKTANVDITLELYEQRSGISGWFKYRTGRFSRQEIEQMADLFLRILENGLDRPESTIDDIIGMNRFPISPLQHGMLMETLRAPHGAGVYVEQIVFGMEQEIDINRFKLAWEKIINHHEILRLGFLWKGLDFPEQYISLPQPLRITYNDWSSINPDEKKEYLDMFLKADRRLGFSLDMPPAFRVALFKMEARRYTCLWSFHHCIADGRSMVFILRDLFLAYKTPGAGLNPAGSFRHYILWLKRQKKARAKKFWTDYLKGFNEPLVFPFSARERPEIQGRRQQHAMSLSTGSHEIRLSSLTSRKIKNMCQQNHFTLNSFLMGAWAVLLSHYTGKTDILFGASVSVRNFEQDRADKTGMYINTVPVRIKVCPDSSLAGFISGIRDQWTAIREYQYLSLTDIHALSPIRGTLPLSEIYFSYDYQSLSSSLDEYKPAVSCSGILLLERTPASIFLVIKGTDDLMVSIEYDQRKFNAGITRRILDHLAVFLKSASENPGACLKDLPVLTEWETQKIAEKLNTWTGHLKSGHCVHQRFEIQAAFNMHMTAVTDGLRSYTYGQLNAFANQMAHFLISKGGGPEKKILLLLEQTPDLIAVLLGVLKSGSCYIPLDISYPDERIRLILADCNPDIVITADKDQKRIRPCKAQIVLIDRDLQEILAMKSVNPKEPVTPENMAYIIYTSGSTGIPKGVVIEHNALTVFTKSAIDIYDIQPNDRVLQFASISFDASAEEIYPALFSGATLVMRPQGQFHTPARFFEFCRQNQLTVIDLPTSYWHLIADEIDTLLLPESLRVVIIGGEEAHPDKVRKWQAHIGDNVRLVNTYGPTETTVAATFCDLSRPGIETGRVPIGRPFPDVNLCILNHFQQPALPGITGELYIGGPQLARGYLNRPDQTEKSFVMMNINQNKRRFFKTGDQALLLPEGQVVFLGRIDRQVKIRGFRVEPGEIERAALSHEQVRECALVVLQDADGNPGLTLFIVPKNAGPGTGPGTGEDKTGTGPAIKEGFDGRDIKSRLMSRLPGYMVPSAMVAVSGLPYTASGKIDYTFLEQMLVEKNIHEKDFRQKEDTGAGWDFGAYPDAGLEEYETGLARIWEEILKINNFSSGDNFFDIGGSSLTAIRLVTAIEKKFAVTLPVLAVFRFPVLKEMAELLRKNDRNFKFSNVKTIRKDGGRAPIFFIAGTNENTMAYQNHDLKGHPFYTVTVFAHKNIKERIVPMDLWETARHNISEILQAEPAGPYIIVGFCRYSIAAFEIATQLTRMGKKVEKLVLIDEFWQKKGMAGFVGHHLKGISRFGLGHILKKIIPKAKEKIHMCSLFLDNKMEAFYSALGKPLPETLQLRLMESFFWKAYKSYMPLPYTGDAVVLDSIQWKEKYDPHLRNYIQGEIKRIETEATHRDWFKPPQMDILIAALDNGIIP